MPITVVVPAHDEAAVIGPNLIRLTRDVEPGRLRVLVVCNGCSDATADRARAVPDVEVQEIPTPSKIAALRVGDTHFDGFPRAYVDADIEVAGAELTRMGAALVESDALVASPRLRLDTSESSWIVRSAMRIWVALPVVQRGLSGRGVFVLTERARDRFDDWPDIVADDGFVERLFSPQERLDHDLCRATVLAAPTARAWVARKARVYRGNRELDGLGIAGRGESGRQWLGVVRADPRRVVDLPAYVLLTVAAKLVDRWQSRRGEVGWGTAERVATS